MHKYRILTNFRNMLRMYSDKKVKPEYKGIYFKAFLLINNK